jgi:hypothetical protein
MFDPRTLPDGDLTYNLAVFLWYGMMLADCLVTRMGIWWYGLAEGNAIMKWFTDKNHTIRTFLDAGIIRPVLAMAFLSASSAAGIVDKAHSWLPFGLVALTAVQVVLNLLKIRAAKAAKK